MSRSEPGRQTAVHGSRIGHQGLGPRSRHANPRVDSGRRFRSEILRLAVSRDGKSFFPAVKTTDPGLERRHRQAKPPPSRPCEPGPVFRAWLRWPTSVFRHADGTIKIWDLTTDAKPITLPGAVPVFSLALSGDDERLFAGSGGGVIKVWDLTGKEPKLLGPLTGHTDGVSSLVVSPDRAKLFSASYDNTIKVWDLQTNKEMLTLPGHTGERKRHFEFGTAGPTPVRRQLGRYSPSGISNRPAKA